MKDLLKLLISFIILINSNLWGQNDYFNTQKYWNLRSRLHESFVSVGAGHGKSLVFQNVHTGSQCVHPNHHHSISGGDILLHHGWYLSVLATEYHLLNLHNLSTEKTFNELYYALKAIDRLDNYAEDLSNYFYEYTWDEANQTFNASPNNLDFQTYHDDDDNKFDFPWENNGHYADNLNGFLIRDDIPPDFHKNFGNKFEKSLFSCARTPPHDIKIDGIVFNDANTSADEMSHDQIIHLLMGLKFVTQYVPGNLEINGYNLVQNAAKQAYRIFMQYFWNEHALLNTDFSINNPATQRKVLRGKNSSLFIYPMYATVLSIVGNNNVVGLPNNVFINLAAIYPQVLNTVPLWYMPYIGTGAVSYYSLPSLWGQMGVSGIYDEVFNTETSPKANFSINLHMSLCLAATSNTWYNGVFPDLSRFNIYQFGHGIGNQEKEIYYLISRAMYDIPVLFNWFSIDHIKSLLNDMCCEGPYRYHLEPNNSHIIACSHQWNRNNKWVEYSMDYYNSGHESEFDGEFPGLDYMLLHNLFYIIHNDESDAQFENFKDMHVKFQYPRFDDHYLGYTHSQVVTNGNDDNTYQNFENYGNDWVYPVIGSHSNPIFFRAFDEIRFSNVVTWNGNLTAQAGKALIWDTPGFEVEPGGFFEAYIKPIECNDINGYHRLSNQDSTWKKNAFPLKQANFIIDGKEMDISKLSTPIYGNLSSKKPIPIFAYPNPASEFITLSLLIEDINELVIEIYDLQGKLCHVQKGKLQNNQMIINISYLKEGLYLINTNFNNQVFQTKFQKINH